MVLEIRLVKILFPNRDSLIPNRESLIPLPLMNDRNLRSKESFNIRNKKNMINMFPLRRHFQQRQNLDSWICIQAKVIKDN